VVEGGCLVWAGVVYESSWEGVGVLSSHRSSDGIEVVVGAALFLGVLPDLVRWATIGVVLAFTYPMALAFLSTPPSQASNTDSESLSWWQFFFVAVWVCWLGTNSYL
jgi:hypothetical protein